MIDLPIIPSAGQNAPSSPVSPINKIIGTLTQGLQNLPIGTTLTGVITQRDANGNTTLSTPKGAITLNTPLLLSLGNQVSFNVLSNAPHLQVQLASINGKPVTRESLPALLGNPQDAKPLMQLTASGNDPTLFKASSGRAENAPPLPAQITSGNSESIQTTIHAPHTGSFIQGKFITILPKALDAIIARAITAGVINSGATIIAQPNTPVMQAAAERSSGQPKGGAAVPPGSTAVFRIIAGSIPTSFPMTTEPAALPVTTAGTPLPQASTPASASQAGSTAALSPQTTPAPTTAAQIIAPHTDGITGAPPTSSAPTGAAPTAPTQGTIPTSAAATQPPSISAALPPTALAPPTITGAPVSTTLGAPPTPLIAALILQPTQPAPQKSIPISTATDSLPLSSPNALQIKGTVIGTELTGEAILKTSLGIVRLPTDLALPKGTELLLELVTITPAQQSLMTANMPLTRRDTVGQLFAHWASLNDMISTLQEQAPDMADKMLKSLIPTTDKQFTASLLNFISSVKDGNVTSWLGMPIIRQLKESGKRETLDKLTQEFTALKNLYSEPSKVNDWQTLIFPLYDGEELHQVHMFVRDHPADEHSENGKDTRFVVEVDTEMLGALQFDGLVHTGHTQKSFDLVVRSREPLPDWMKLDITNLFTEAGEITGMKGGLNFHATPDFPLKPIEDVLAADHSSIIV